MAQIQNLVCGSSLWFPPLTYICFSFQKVKLTGLSTERHPLPSYYHKQGKERLPLCKDVFNFFFFFFFEVVTSISYFSVSIFLIGFALVVATSSVCALYECSGTWPCQQKTQLPVTTEIKHILNGISIHIGNLVPIIKLKKWSVVRTWRFPFIMCSLCVQLKENT